MAQSLAAILSDVVTAADAIYKLWTDRVRNPHGGSVYVEAPATVTPCSAKRVRTLLANLPPDHKATILRPEAESCLHSLRRNIDSALSCGMPAAISYSDLEAGLTDLQSRAESLVDNLEMDVPDASRFREARDRIGRIAKSISAAAVSSNGTKIKRGKGRPRSEKIAVRNGIILEIAKHGKLVNAPAKVVKLVNCDRRFMDLELQQVTLYAVRHVLKPLQKSSKRGAKSKNLRRVNTSLRKI